VPASKPSTSTEGEKTKKFVPTCYHCGESGHILPQCTKLKSFPRIKVDIKSKGVFKI